jgi:hypothetical protein
MKRWPRVISSVLGSRSRLSRTSRIVVMAMMGTFFGIQQGLAQQQSVGEALSSLLLTQSGPYPVVDKDRLAAEATRDTLGQLLLVELSTLPTTTSSAGFVYRFNSELGTLERTSAHFGPFFTERALRAGRHQLSAGVTFRYADFTTLQGSSLTSGDFPVNAARVAGAQEPYGVDTVNVRLQTRTITAFGTYGLNDRLDVGAAVPVVSLHFTGTRDYQWRGTSIPQSFVLSNANGVGDVALTARYAVDNRILHSFAVGTDLRLPTGSSSNLLGAGRTAAKFLAIGSMERSRVASHVNVGYSVGGASREFTYNGAMTLAANPRLTLVGEFIGRRVSDLHTLQAVYEPNPLAPRVETMRWLPEGDHVYQSLVATGAKWNLTRSYLLNANILIRLTDVGLTARVVPSISIDYTFQR